MGNDKDETGVQILPEMTVRKETDYSPSLVSLYMLISPPRDPLHPANILPTAINRAEYISYKYTTPFSVNPSHRG